MDCHHYRRQLDFARPGVTELDAADIAALEHHLAMCAECSMVARVDRTQYERIAAAMQDVETPTGLRDRLLATIQQHRKAWWRRLSIRTAVVGSALAVGWWAYPAPRFDADAVISASLEQYGNQVGVQEWLANQNARFDFPPSFRSKYLVSYERRDIFGVNAPVLTFVKRNSLARVVVLTPGQFRNLASLPTGRVVDNSVSTIVVLRNENNRGVVYLVEVLNGPLEPFGTDDEPSAT